MSRQRYNLMVVLCAAAALFAIHRVARDDVFTFGHHGAGVKLLSELLLALLCLTDVFLIGIMWTQRRRWDAAEASLFRFMAARALLWGFTFFYARQAPGITLGYGFLLVILILTAVDLNLQLVRRYGHKREDDATDLRQRDPPGTAGEARIVEHGWTDEPGDGP